MHPDRPFSLGVIILAAGASSRMGQPKLLLPWGDTTVMGHLLATWKELQAVQIAAVVAPANTAIDAELTRGQFPAANRILNPQPERGMFSSIQCAAQWNGWQPALTDWAIVLGDQPHLRPATLRALLNFAAQHSNQVVQPARNGRPRHPVLLPRVVFEKLGAAPDQNLKQFLQAQSTEIRCVELDDPGLDLDMDCPKDYERARQLFFGPQRGLVQS